MSDTPDNSPAKLVEDTVQRMRPVPGTVPPEAPAAVLDRLFEAWVLTSTINRLAGEAHRMALRVALVSAPFGPYGNAAEKIVQSLLTRLDQHLATLPDKSSKLDGP